jgi:outer membrane protein assembly complex protein YaeT
MARVVFQWFIAVGSKHLRHTAILVGLSAVLACAMASPSTSFAQPNGVRIDSLEFRGVESVDESRIRRILATRESSRWPWGEEHFFDPRAFETDLIRIEAFYIERGFPEARVTSFDVRFSPDRTHVELEVGVEEGQPALAESVVLTGFEPLPEAALRNLRRRMPLQPGVRLDRQFLLESQRLAIVALGDAGYPFAEVRVFERVIEPLRVDVTLQAEAGPRAFFGPITIVGNRAVDDGVIRRQLLFRPGEPYRRETLRDSQRKLTELGLFEFANVTLEQQEEPTAEVPVVVTVSEGPQRRVEFGVGYGTEERARGEARLRHVNFLGGARMAGVHAKLSSLEQGVQLNFREPYFLRPDLSLTIEGRGWYADEPIYRALSRGGRVAVAYRYSPRTQFRVSLLSEFESSRVTAAALEDPTIRDDLIAMGFDPRTGVQDGTLSALMLDVMTKATDSLLNPTRGYTASIHLEQAGNWFPGTFNYYNVLGEVRHYVSPVWRLVFANRVRFGSIEPVTAPGDVPFFKRYFLGGSTSLRGWGRFQIGPLSGAGLPIGGHTMFEASSEVRFPAFGGLGVVLFVDAGNVWAGSWDFDFGDLRYAAGPGLRYDTPVGPIRVDLGYQLTPIGGLLVNGEPETRRWRIHFSIGQAF